jgi:hypothetical protein
MDARPGNKFKIPEACQGCGKLAHLINALCFFCRKRIYARGRYVPVPEHLRKKGRVKSQPLDSPAVRQTVGEPVPEPTLHNPGIETEHTD